MNDREKEGELRRLEGVIRHQKNLLVSAQMLNSVSSITLLEQTVKYLEELREIKRE